MESHIMNVPYHQARYRTIGHKIMRTTSDSLSSESSCCNQNSPEYKAQDPGYERNHYEEESNEAQDWQNQTVNITQSSQETSDDEDEDEQIEVQELQYEVKDTDSLVYDPESSEADNIEENSLVEGDDYDIIQVYAVDPNLDLEASSEDDDQPDFTVQNYTETEVEYVNSDDCQYNQTNCVEKPPDILNETLNIDLDTPVVSNVDEYFIKVDNSKDILEVKDEPVVQDVDEYFIKDVAPRIPNVDDFFIKHKVPEEESTKFHIDKLPSKVDELFRGTVEKKGTKTGNVQQQNNDIAINESDLEVLPNIEDLKRFLMDDMPCTKLKNAQRSCSLPHSPINICMDIDDAKTCLSFEDLNLDLTDLTFDKSDSLANKSDDIPRTLTEEDVNSFLITNKPNPEIERKDEDDFNPQDMEIERPVESSINTMHETPIVVSKTKEKIVTTAAKQMTKPAKQMITPFKQMKPPAVLKFCVEKSNSSTPIKKVATDIKAEPDDFIDVESCNDTVVPVLEANNLSSLLEQFEATEKLNTKTKRLVIKPEEPKLKSTTKGSLTNGMRLQDAGVQLNKNKMRHILMPSTINAAVQRSPSPVHSDHDYCTSKKRHSLPNLKGGQSLLKPEVLSSNSRILNSRHRSCKNKKIDYNLSSDDESEKCNNNNKNKKNVNTRDDSDVKFKKLTIKQPVKPIAQATCRKKLSPKHSSTNDSVKNISVINKNASKASDTPCSQSSNGSIKLTIKNKSEVILSCDLKDSHKSKHSEKSKNISVSDKSSNNDKTSNTVKETKDKAKDVKTVKNVREVEVSIKPKPVHNKEPVKESLASDVVSIKEEPKDNFYTALFSNKQDVLIPVAMVKTEKRPFDEELQRISDITIKKEMEQPQKKKKLNIHEYKMRKVNSNNSSTTVSPEAIFPDLPHLNVDKTLKSTLNQTPNNADHAKNQINPEPKKIFDPIRDASRKILMNSMKQKALRKRDEDIVMSKIPKVENLQLQPLISDAEMMKIVGMTPAEELAIPVAPERPQASADYEEIILVSVGVNTDDDDFRKLEILRKLDEKRKSKSPQADAKSFINFKIKKSDHVLKQNVFEAMKRDKRSPINEKKQEPKIDKERYKDITAALKRAGKQVDPKISSNSLFSSIQDVVMKKAPDDVNKGKDGFSKPTSPTEKKDAYKYVKTTIVREYDTKAEHGEDKVILHLRKDRTKPASSNIVVQTETDRQKSKPTEQIRVPLSETTTVHKEVSTSRKRNDSDMSMSSECSPVRNSKSPKKEKEKTVAKPKENKPQKRSLSKEKRSRSKDKYEVKHRRRSRSHSRSRRRRKLRSRSRSRSGGRYSRYRRSDSSYRWRRRSRSPYRRRPSPRRSPPGRRSANDRHSSVSRRSPSVRRNHRRSRTRSGQTDPRRSKTPIQKKPKLTPQNSIEKVNEKKPMVSLTPPLRKPTISESSEFSMSSSSSSSSSSASSDDSSRRSRGSCSPYKRDESFRKNYRSYSSEDRESNTPVEERRIVFVGKLEKDVTKLSLKTMFSKFGHVMEVRLHSKEDGTRYGFVTYQRARDAWSAVEAASTFPQYDVGFGGRRAFCRQSYADLDGIEANYTESAFHGQATALPARRTNDMSFEQMLLEMKKKLNERKGDKKNDKP